MLLYEPCNSALSCQAHILQQQVADLTAKLAAFDVVAYDAGVPFAAASAWRAECGRLQEKLADANAVMAGQRTTIEQVARSQASWLCEAHQSEFESLEQQVAAAVAGRNAACADLLEVQQQLAGMTQERDRLKVEIEKATSIIKNLIPLAPITESDIRWAQAALKAKP